VSSLQFSFLIFFLNIHLLPYPRANRPPTLTCDSSQGTSDLKFLFFFDFKLRREACAFSAMPPFLLCADCLFCVWYPISTTPGTWTLFLMLLLRSTRKLVVIIQFQPAPVHQTFLPFSIQSLQLCISSFCNIGNLICPKPMRSKLPRMIHELTFIYQYQITLLKYLLLDVFVMVGILSFLLYLLMKSNNKSVFF
jgi:hypothetical protein